MLRRDRIVVAAALLLITALAWASLLSMSSGAGADMSDMAMKDMTPSAWSRVDFILTFLMWAVMMVGMMTPSAAPMILIYAGVARKAAAGNSPFASAGWFVAGYLLVWIGFAVAATSGQSLLDRAALLSDAMNVSTPVVAAAILIVAGLYQWTPLKQSCLILCRSPLRFIQQHGGFRGTRRHALRLGLTHGVQCVGCCWALMILLFLGGVMNLLWVAAIAVLVLVEKLVPAGPWLSRLIGVALLIAGAVLLVGK